MGVAAQLALAVAGAVAGLAATPSALTAAGAAGAAGAATPAALEETRGAVSVDWGEGTLTARGGAAADLHMPSADLARPGAERRARAAALARLKQALAELPLGRRAHADRRRRRARALGHAQVVDVEYQSNGGAVVRMRVPFGDWLPAEPPAGPTFSVGETHLAAAPEIRIGGKEIVTGAARYRLGAPPAGAHAVAIRIDHDGRWLPRQKGDKVDKVDKVDKDFTEKLAGAAIVIYVQKVLK